MSNQLGSGQQLLKTLLKDTTQKNKLNLALENYLKDIAPKNLQKVSEIPFSSDRKYSAVVYGDQTLVLGAPEILLAKDSRAFQDVQTYTAASLRVVVFGMVQGQIKVEDDIKDKFQPLATIAIDDPIREEISGVLDQLTAENIQYRIISGDSADTVLAIAKKINPKFSTQAISGGDLEKLAKEVLEKAIIDHNIFARIKPHQKQLIIRTLKKNKLFTIMVGDGVNDVLALKEADLGVAMNAGSSMAKDVADVVLLDNSFATLPKLLYQGRRIITNIQTIANIYLMKNISSIAAILMLGFIGLRFPFDPKHVELSSLLIIGIPSFVLAFENHSFAATDEGFIKRLLLFSGVVGFGNAILYTIVYLYYDITSEKLFYSRTMLLLAVIFLGLNNIILIYLQHYRLRQILFRKIVAGLLASLLLLFVLGLLVVPVREFFEVAEINLIDFALIFTFCALGSAIIALLLKRLKLIGILNANITEDG